MDPTTRKHETIQHVSFLHVHFAPQLPCTLILVLPFLAGVLFLLFPMHDAWSMTFKLE